MVEHKTVEYQSLFFNKHTKRGWQNATLFFKSLIKIKDMKKLLFLTIALLTFTLVSAQDTLKPRQSNVELTPYVSTGISIPNTTDFSANSYWSAEVGIMIDNISFGAVFGVNNLDSFNKGIDSYWYEGKVAYSFPLGIVDGYGVLGIGSYIGTKGSIFLEYGGGISKSFGKFGTFIQVSSWDKIMYITPGISYSF